MKINVQALNECLNIDGPIWIEDNLDNCIPLPNNYVFNSEWQRELAKKMLLKEIKPIKVPIIQEQKLGK